MGSNNFYTAFKSLPISATANRRTGIETQFFFFPFL